MAFFTEPENRILKFMQKYQILKDILSRKMIIKYNINTRLKNYINIVKKIIGIGRKTDTRTNETKVAHIILHATVT